MNGIVQGRANPWRRMPLVALLCLLALFAEVALAGEPHVAVNVAQSGEAFIVDATIDVPVRLGMAWEVLIDFDHMTSILGNLKSSKVASRDGNTWIVRQEGVARYGLLSFSFVSEREIRLEPMTRILARSLSGPVKRMESEARIIAQDQGVRISYHAESVPDSVLARIFGAPFVRHEVREQFLAMSREMIRRQSGAEPTAAR